MEAGNFKRRTRGASLLQSEFFFSSSAGRIDLWKKQGWGQGSLRHIPVQRGGGGGGGGDQMGWDLKRDACRSFL